jgi:hypothetical protein
VTTELRSFLVYGFDSTHEALRAERALIAADIEVALIPTPRALGSSCGFAVRVPLAVAERAADVLAEAGVDSNGVVEIEDRARVR